MSQVIDLFNEIRAALGELESDIAVRTQELGGIKSEIESANQETTATTLALENMKRTSELEVARLRDKTNKFTAENNRVMQENSALVAKKAELQIALIELEKKNEEFVAYEKRAWKELENKDQSLQERETIIEEREGLKPRRKTFLPPKQ